MGIHTSIYRERRLRYGDYEKYQIRLFNDNREIKLYNPVSLREKFYLGKSVWAINEWLYKYVKKENGQYINEDFSHECIYNESIYIDDLKKLLDCVKGVLEDHKKAKKILPMPKSLKLVKPKEKCFAKESGEYIVKSGSDWENVPRDEMYDEYYFENLERVKVILERIIREDEADTDGLIEDYIIEVL